MTSDTPTYTELEAARAECTRLRAEAAEDRKKTEEALAKAEYQRGQAEHRARTAEATERSIAEREQKLKELNEGALLTREAEARAALARGQELQSLFDKAKYQALRTLTG